MRPARFAGAVGLAAAALLAGCGGGGASPERAAAPAPAPKGNALVDASLEPPYVNSLEIDPDGGDFLLTTNRGAFRIDRATDRATRVRGLIRDRAGQSSPVGTYLEVTAIGPGEYLGSGHPDVADAGLPEFLGLIRSLDAGRTWSPVSRLGEADLHQVVVLHGRIYGWDAVLGALLVSADGGRTWAERFTPRGLVLDIAIDPEDPARVVASTDVELFRSTDEGRRWRTAARGEAFRLAWPARGSLFRAAKDGTVSTSPDGGTVWNEVGKVPGEPYRLRAVSATELYAVLADARIVGTRDGGKTWTPEFTPVRAAPTPAGAQTG